MVHMCVLRTCVACMLPCRIQPCRQLLPCCNYAAMPHSAALPAAPLACFLLVSRFAQLLSCRTTFLIDVGHCYHCFWSSSLADVDFCAIVMYIAPNLRSPPPLLRTAPLSWTARSRTLSQTRGPFPGPPCWMFRAAISAALVLGAALNLKRSM